MGLGVDILSEMSIEILEKYPKTKHFLETTGMTLDQALIFTEREITKLKQEVGEDAQKRQLS